MMKNAYLKMTLIGYSVLIVNLNNAIYFLILFCGFKYSKKIEYIKMIFI